MLYTTLCILLLVKSLHTGMHMLQVIPIYVTSKGYFVTLCEAEKKVNRPKVGHGEYPDSRETIQVRQALTDGESYFLLNQVEVN